MPSWDKNYFHNLQWTPSQTIYFPKFNFLFNNMHNVVAIINYLEFTDHLQAYGHLLSAIQTWILNQIQIMWKKGLYNWIDNFCLF